MINSKSRICAIKRSIVIGVCICCCIWYIVKLMLVTENNEGTMQNGNKCKHYNLKGFRQLFLRIGSKPDTMLWIRSSSLLKMDTKNFISLAN